MSSRLGHAPTVEKLSQSRCLTHHVRFIATVELGSPALSALHANRPSFFDAQTRIASSTTRRAPRSPPRPAFRSSHSSTRKFSCSSSYRRQNNSTPPTTASQIVRHLMRSVPHPVAIITATDPLSSTPQTQIQRSRGATVSSFNTVCLDPIPVVSFNITRLSSTFHALEQSNQFAVHLLRSNNAAVNLASRFSRGNATNPFIGLFSSDLEEGPKESDLVAPQSPSMSWVEPTVDLPPPPLLLHLHNQQHHTHQEPAIYFSLSCKYLRDKTVVVGDHVVVLGAVEQVWDLATEGTTSGRSGNEDSARTVQQQCLSYVNGGYRGVR